MALYRQEIEREELAVLFVDECHLLAGDLCGYVWGRTDERAEIPMENEKERQTYYGALNLMTRSLLVNAQERGNTDCTIAYLKYLRKQLPNQRLLIFWDGASYHKSKALREYLEEVNQGLAPEEWKIHCVLFAPNDPTQNPIEDAWLQAKTWLRRMSGLRPSFSALKDLFELFCHLDTFDFPKLQMYGNLS